MIRNVINFFDKLEDVIRGHLSRYPILYTFIGAIAVVLFWRGVWYVADVLEQQGGVLGWLFYEPVNLILVIVIMLMTGLFVSYFIGDTIIISGLKGQKKITDKTDKDIKDEETELSSIKTTIKEMKKEVDEIREVVEHEHNVHHHPEIGK